MINFVVVNPRNLINLPLHTEVFLLITPITFYTQLILKMIFRSKTFVNYTIVSIIL